MGPFFGGWGSFILQIVESTPLVGMFVGVWEFMLQFFSPNIHFFLLQPKNQEDDYESYPAMRISEKIVKKF